MKNANIMLRVSAAEKAEMQAAANADKRTLSDWIRLVALAAAKSALTKEPPGGWPAVTYTIMSPDQQTLHDRAMAGISFIAARKP